MICEECEEREAEKDVIIDGVLTKLCGRCAPMSGGIMVEKPSQVQVDESKRMWRVREILSQHAGIPYKNPYERVSEKPQFREINLDDLRKVDKEKKSMYQLRAEQRMKSEQESQKKQAQEIVNQSKDIKNEVELIDE